MAFSSMFSGSFSQGSENKVKGTSTRMYQFQRRQQAKHQASQPTKERSAELYLIAVQTLTCTHLPYQHWTFRLNCDWPIWWQEGLIDSGHMVWLVVDLTWRISPQHNWSRIMEPPISTKGGCLQGRRIRGGWRPISSRQSELVHLPHHEVDHGPEHRIVEFLMPVEIFVRCPLWGTSVSRYCLTVKAQWGSIRLNKIQQGSIRFNKAQQGSIRINKAH